MYATWARLERSGLPSDIIRQQLIAVLGESLKNSPLKSLNNATPLSSQLSQAHIIYPWETALLQVGEQSGAQEKALDYLASYTKQRHETLSALRKKLSYPMAIWVVSLFVIPLPQIARGELSVTTYLIGIVCALSSVVLAYYLIRHVYTLYRHERLPSALSDAISQFLMLFKPVRIQTLYRYLSCMSIGLSAGLPADQSISLASRSFVGNSIRRRFAEPLSAVNNGNGVAESLKQCGIIDGQLYASLQSAELAGELPQMQQHWVRLAQQSDEPGKSFWIVAAPLAFYLIFAAVVFL